MPHDASASRARPAPPLTVGEAIAFAAEKRGLSLRAVSLEAGLSDAACQKIVSGASQPSLRTFARVARALRMTPMEVWVVLANEAAIATRGTGDQPISVTPPEENDRR